jgi:hypothetical protein
MAQQTAVEWLINHWKKLQSEGEKMNWSQIIQITELAKEMEKQQIMDAFDIRKVDIAFDKKTTSEQYYTETYNNGK